MLRCSKLSQNAETPLVVLGQPRTVAVIQIKTTVVMNLLSFQIKKKVQTLQTWFTRKGLIM